MSRGRNPRPTKILGLWLQGLLLILVVLTPVVGLSYLRNGIDLRSLSDTRPLLPFAAIPRPLPRVVDDAISFVSLATLVVWLVWQHRSQANLMVIPGRRLKFSPGWAVGWWFVPLFNLFMPFLAVRELWTWTAGESPSRRTSPATLGAWWAFYVLSHVLSVVAGWLGFSAGRLSDGFFVVKVHAISLSRFAGASGQLLVFLSGILAITLVRDIDRAMGERLEEWPPRPDAPLTAPIASDRPE